ncbi:Signal peptidase I [Novipirellula aureliae]|uniref:Signal peptidase I n=1 Tax=Novipirellula aureliae TaxID=2527966 RepID=A0A5C6DHK3_9BACT|nr:signal peptidase I [Novipirellula aureliae]TWU35317.1 Signal peptidase I [Novipirellula aureliae]
MSRKPTSKTASTESPSEAEARIAAEKASKVEETRSDAEIRAESFRTGAQRETVEAFVVAFILALLFRAFLAEAFVIPTGSMAPTLMGAHKDVRCDRCGMPFQVGASLERRGPTMEKTVVAGICPNCRHVNPMDLVNEPNDSTFNGDRILVSKFAYTICEPERWDVIVFKFPGNPKQNYIKRLVGLPKETLTLRHGDVYAHPTGSTQRPEILRKPAKKILSMRHIVHDTDYQSGELIQANYPSRWQPWQENAATPPTDSWQIERTSDSFVAMLKDASDTEPHWLRYFHRWPTEQQWAEASNNQKLANVDPYSSRLITDFYAYDSYIQVNADQVYSEPPSLIRNRSGGRSFVPRFGYSKGVFDPDYQPGVGPDQFRGRAAYGAQGFSKEGVHWVGDLMLEANIETSPSSKELIVELVEAGIRYQCQFDLTSGRASLSIFDQEETVGFDADGESNLHPTAETSVLAGSKHSVRMSNFDDQIVLWVDDNLVSFDTATTFDSRSFRTDAEDHPRYGGLSHPLDAAPVAVAVRGGDATIDHLKVDRDKYYIATKDAQESVIDYDMRKVWQVFSRSMSQLDIQELMTHPADWNDSPLWQTRRSVSFVLEDDQFFPMGDNSPESLDARCWAGTKVRFGMPEGADRWSDASYVPRDLLVGKALVVFWPHSWNSPVPFTPNFRRMKLIR